MFEGVQNAASPVRHTALHTEARPGRLKLQGRVTHTRLDRLDSEVRHGALGHTPESTEAQQAKPELGDGICDYAVGS